MKNWKTPEIKKLEVKKTAHTVKWMTYGGCMGWHKFNDGHWDFCGQNYQPSKEDVIDNMES